MEPLTGTGAPAKRKAQRSKPAKEELLTSSHEEAKELCRLAQQIGTLAPWEWMRSSKLKGIAQTQLEMEADLFMGPGAIGKRGYRPAALFTLMLADHESGFLFGVEAMAAEQGLAAMYADVPNSIALMLLRAQLLPKRLLVRSARLFELLKPLTQTLNVELFYVAELPAIEEAADVMFEALHKK